MNTEDIKPIKERASLYARRISKNDTYRTYLLNAFTEGARQEAEIWKQRCLEEVGKAFEAGEVFNEVEGTLFKRVALSKEEYIEQLKKTL